MRPASKIVSPPPQVPSSWGLPKRPRHARHVHRACESTCALLHGTQARKLQTNQADWVLSLFAVTNDWKTSTQEKHNAKEQRNAVLCALFLKLHPPDQRTWILLLHHFVQKARETPGSHFIVLRTRQAALPASTSEIFPRTHTQSIGTSDCTFWSALVALL